MEQVEESVEQIEENVKLVEKSKQQCTSTVVSTEMTSTDTDCIQRDCKFNKEGVIKLTGDINV